MEEKLFEQIPSWLPDLSAPSLVLIFGFALAKNWLYTRGQIVDLLNSSKELAAVWKEIAQTNQETIKIQAEQLEPIVSSSAAILKIVEELQRQSYYNQRGGRRQ